MEFEKLKEKYPSFAYKLLDYKDTHPEKYLEMFGSLVSLRSLNLTRLILWALIVDVNLTIEIYSKELKPNYNH